MANTQNEYTPMQTLICMVAAGAKGETVNDLQVDWASVLPIVAEQRVQSLVACALLYSPKLECPAELHGYLLNAMRLESSVNLIRRQRIMHLLQEMKAAGIDAKLIKGYAVSGCYAHPECRGSVDTDILIDVQQEAKTISFFESCGFCVERRAATSNHTVCQHKKYGIVELHVSLYGELVRDNWFHMLDVNDMVQESTVAADEFDTLGYTDQLIFLTLHMVKHFILGGLTLRMMLDIGLYFANHKQRIDTVRYWTTLKNLRYDKLTSAILWTFIRWGRFSEEEFPGISEECPEQTSLILSDLLTGGYMGAKEKNERFESGMEYNRKLILKQKNVTQYRLRMIGWKIKSGTKYMFPSVKMLRKLYPITIRMPILMPFLWGWQVVSFPMKKIASGALKRDVRSEQSVISTVAKERVAMFEKLEML